MQSRFVVGPSVRSGFQFRTNLELSKNDLAQESKNLISDLNKYSRLHKGLSVRTIRWNWPLKFSTMESDITFDRRASNYIADVYASFPPFNFKSEIPKKPPEKSKNVFRWPEWWFESNQMCRNVCLNWNSARPKQSRFFSPYHCARAV